MRILTFSTLYPSSVRPGHGIFVETRLRKLVETGQVDAKVVAPVPWFFSRHPRFGRYSRMASTPHRESRGGIEVIHPRYAHIPGMSMNMAPILLAAGAYPTLVRLCRQGFDFDLIDAHYFFPDSVAAVLLGRLLDKPVVCTARGSDITLFPRFPIARRWIRWAAQSAARNVAVCQALSDELGMLMQRGERPVVLRNGVDLERFVPVNRSEARRRLGLPLHGPIVVSVGNLVELKGHDLTILAMLKVQDGHLLLIGDGDREASLRNLAASNGLTDRIHFIGRVPQEELKYYYSAANVSVLASSREGWANVLLESMACGTPVAASRVWGTPEVVAAPEGGLLFDERTPDAIAAAVSRLLMSPPTRDATRSYAEQFSWDATTAGQLSLFRDVLRGDARDSGRRAR